MPSLQPVAPTWPVTIINSLAASTDCRTADRSSSPYRRRAWFPDPYQPLPLLGPFCVSPNPHASLPLPLSPRRRRLGLSSVFETTGTVTFGGDVGKCRPVGRAGAARRIGHGSVSAAAAAAVSATCQLRSRGQSARGIYQNHPPFARRRKQAKHGTSSTKENSYIIQIRLPERALYNSAHNLTQQVPFMHNVFHSFVFIYCCPYFLSARRYA